MVCIFLDTALSTYLAIQDSCRTRCHTVNSSAHSTTSVPTEQNVSNNAVRGESEAYCCGIWVPLPASSVGSLPYVPVCSQVYSTNLKGDILDIHQLRNGKQNKAHRCLLHSSRKQSLVNGFCHFHCILLDLLYHLDWKTWKQNLFHSLILIALNLNWDRPFK